MANGFNTTPLLQGGNVQGLLGNPLFTGGLGLLAGTFDDDLGTAQTFGLGLQGAQQGLGFQQQMLQNQAAREQLKQQARQRAARQQLLQEMAGGPVGPGTGTGFGLLTPQEASDRRTPGLDINDPNQLGLLAEAAPEAVFGQGGILSQQLSTEAEGDPLITLGNGMKVRFSELTKNGQDLIQAGLVPGSAEFSQIMKEAVAGGNVNQADIIQAEAAATLAQIEVSREVRTERSRKIKAESAIRDTAKNVIELADINESINDDLLTRPGIGFNELRQAVAEGRAFFSNFLELEDAEESQRKLSEVKRFQQLALEENIKNIETLRETIGGRVTQLEFGKGLLIGPNSQQTPVNNAKSFLDLISDLRVAAKIEGVALPSGLGDTEEQLRDFIASQGSVGDPQVTPTESPRSGETVDLGDGVTLEFQ